MPHGEAVVSHGEAGRLWWDDVRLVQSTTSISNGFRSTTCWRRLSACSRVERVYVGCVRVCACACVCGLVCVGFCVRDCACGLCGIPRCTDSNGPIREGRTAGFSGTRGGSGAARTSSALQPQCRSHAMALVAYYSIVHSPSDYIYDAIRPGGVRRDRLGRKGAAVLDDAHATQRMPRRRHAAST